MLLFTRLLLLDIVIDILNEFLFIQLIVVFSFCSFLPIKQNICGRAHEIILILPADAGVIELMPLLCEMVLREGHVVAEAH